MLANEAALFRKHQLAPTKAWALIPSSGTDTSFLFRPLPRMYRLLPKFGTSQIFPSPMRIQDQVSRSLETLAIVPENLGVSTGRGQWAGQGQVIASYSPADGKEIAKVQLADADQFQQVVGQAQEAFRQWRATPAPQRGELIRQIGLKLREKKEALGTLVSYEMGKIYQEGLGEVQEMIDIADFALGLSRQLYGLTIASERPQHRMMEQWHPLGPVGIISAFNFPVAVYSWNAFVAIVCGDPVIWKPSDKSTLCAVAVQNLIREVLNENDWAPEGLFNLVPGGTDIGERIAAEKRIPLVSATGSTAMGKKVGPTVASRLGKSILELGGNNAIVLTPHADLDMALRATLFGAVGTAGQRCTSTRRLIVHRDVYDDFKAKLVQAYSQLRMGHPLEEGTLVGPLIDPQAVNNFQEALDRVKAQGGTVLIGGETLEGEGYENGLYVHPALAEVSRQHPMLQEEVFGPLLYLVGYDTLEEAIAIHNDVPQGLSSAIFSLNMREVEQFVSAAGADCGIVNANIGTSGAEIGGAFGGEKDTGGGRESGSDAWKAYMRRQTNTINYGSEMPLAQGIRFDV
jgi:aldehyde dehydrogenase (NAD+)